MANISGDARKADQTEQTGIWEAKGSVKNNFLSVKATSSRTAKCPYAFFVGGGCINVNQTRDSGHMICTETKHEHEEGIDKQFKIQQLRDNIT